jgi:hypothetical protein
MDGEDAIKKHLRSISLYKIFLLKERRNWAAKALLVNPDPCYRMTTG